MKNTKGSEIRCAKGITFFDYFEPETDASELEYSGRGESVYAEGRQVMVRACNDALVIYREPEKEPGILLVKRMQEPMTGDLWPLGGGYSRGMPTSESLTEKVREESGLEIDSGSLRLLTIANFMWKTTPYSGDKKEILPKGTHDLALLFYCEGVGKLNLNSIHEKPLIVTKEMYTEEFRKSLPPYTRAGMDVAMQFL